MEESVRAAIRQYIVHTWLSGDARGFEDETDLQESGILDSFSTLALIGFLDDTYKIQLEPSDVNAETFKSVSRVARLVMDKTRKDGAAGTP